jgi:ribonuclease HII
MESDKNTTNLTIKTRGKPRSPLKPYFSEHTSFEIGIDEAGRGPLFGRVYVAAVILPKDPELFHHEWMRDSKQIKSIKKMNELANYIKANALSWSITYAEADEIDNQNILNCVIRCMHKCCNEIFGKIDRKYSGDGLLLVDGNYFRPYMHFDTVSETFINIPHETVEKGDGTYSSIAAASILAKHARDSYIADLCVQYPVLSERYLMDKNMGYGTKAHIEGIHTYGITQYHRKTFNICRGEHETIL